MKSVAKKFIVMVMACQVKRLRKRHNFRTIVVGGSIGKTSTKFAIAAVLKQKYQVRFQEGNYNDIVSVPLVFFGLQMPSLTNPLAWLKVFLQTEKQIRAEYPFDIVLLELGTDGPGQMTDFKRYIHADFGVLTAITPEHMEYFVDLDEVAKEELAVEQLCNKLLVNIDLCDPKYVSQLVSKPATYSVRETADYKLLAINYHENGYEFDISKTGQNFLHLNHETIAESQLYSLCAATAIGDLLEIQPSEIEKGLHSIQAVNGRMQRLLGVNNSIIIDDTYNASPEAVKGALDTLYKIKSPQKIAILGNMNELGKYSEAAHTEIGNYCDPGQLNMVITIGADANTYLAPAAERRGCRVKTFTNPYEAGKYLRDLIHDKAVILAKGSQNSVFAEETVKLLLNNPNDSSKLVRQSPEWMKTKQKQFGDAT